MKRCCWQLKQRVIWIAACLLMIAILPVHGGWDKKDLPCQWTDWGWEREHYDEILGRIRNGTVDRTGVFTDSMYYRIFTIDLYDRRKPEEALNILEKAKQIWPDDPEIYGLMSTVYGVCLNNPARAEESYKKALDTFHRHADDYRKRNCLHYTLAEVYEKAGEYEKAVQEYWLDIRSGDQMKRVVAWAPRTQWTTLCFDSSYWKGWKVTDQRLWQPREAIKFLEKALDLWPDNAVICRYIGSGYAGLMGGLGDYPKAQEYFRRALDATYRQPDYQSTYVYEGNPPKPRKCVKPSYTQGVFLGDALWEISDLTGKLVLCYLAEIDESSPDKAPENTAEAERLCLRTLQTLDKLSPGRDLSNDDLMWPRHRILLLLAQIYGDYPQFKGHDAHKALEYARKGYELEKELCRNRRDRRPLSGGLLGVECLHAGKHEDAVKYLGEFCAIRNNPAIWVTSPDPMYARYKLSEAYEKIGRMDQAYRSIQDSLVWVKGAVDFYAGSDEQKLAAVGRKWRRIFDRAIRLSLQLGHKEEAFEIIEKAKARAMLDLVGLGGTRGKDRSLVEKQRERMSLEAKIREMQAKVGDQRKSDERSAELASLQRSLVLVEDRTKKLREDIERSRREIVTARKLDTMSWKGVTQVMRRANATLIEYWDTNLVAVVTRDGFDIVTLTNGIPLETVEKFREAIVSQAAAIRGLDIEKDAGKVQSRKREVEKMSRELYDILIRPIEAQIKTQVLFISPDTQLHLLPFQALHDGTNYLVEKYSLAYAPSGSVLNGCMFKRKKVKGNVLAFGNPNLKDPRYKLAHAEEEAGVVSKIFPESVALIGDDANEKSLQLLGGDYNVLHFACHGTVNLDDPMLSCLRLAPDGENDGYLHAGEVFDLYLNAALVTLSACESGVGKITYGSEMLGLPRAFMFAGTPSVVASLWKVDDAATSDLMVAFYSNLKTMNKGEALRQAQIKMIKEGKTPFQWAAFCLYGDNI